MTGGNTSTVVFRSVLATAVIASFMLSVQALNEPSFKQDWSAPGQVSSHKRSTKYEELMKAGREHLSKRRYIEAHESFYGALKQEPGDEECTRQLISFWETIVRLNPNDTNHIGLGQVYQYNSNYNMAEKHFKEALRLNPKNALAAGFLKDLPEARKDGERRQHMDSGIDLQVQHLYDDAIREYQDVLSANPCKRDKCLAYFNIATAYDAKDDRLTASKYYIQALLINPGNKTSSNRLMEFLKDWFA